MNTQDLSRRLGVASRFEANEMKDLLTEAADTIDAQAAEIARLSTECKNFAAETYKTKLEAQTTFDHQRDTIARLQAISLQPAHDAVTIDCMNDRLMYYREAMQAALEALNTM